MDTEEIRRRLSANYPRMSYSEMEPAWFYFSLEYHGEGDLVNFEGRTYEVEYGWIWYTYKGVAVCCAEVHPHDG